MVKYDVVVVGAGNAALSSALAAKDNGARNILVLDSKLKIADITQHSLVRSEKISLKDDNKGVVKSYEMNADNTLTDATISGYKIVSKKVMKEKNGWRTMVLLEFNLI